MVPEAPLQYSQDPTTCLHPEPDESSPRSPILFFKNICNIILPSTPSSSMHSLSFNFCHRNLYAPLPFLHTCHMSCPSLLGSTTRVIFSYYYRTCVIMHYVMKMAIELHTFLTVDVDGGHWLDSHPCRFTPREIPPLRIGPTRISWYVIYLRPQMSPYVQVSFFQPTCKRDICNIVFVTVCRDRRWPS